MYKQYPRFTGEKLRCRKVKNFPKFTQLVDDSTGSEPSHLTQEPRVLPPHHGKDITSENKDELFFILTESRRKGKN